MNYGFLTLYIFFTSICLFSLFLCKITFVYNYTSTFADLSEDENSDFEKDTAEEPLMSGKSLGKYLLFFMTQDRMLRD